MDVINTVHVQGRHTSKNPYKCLFFLVVDCGDPGTVQNGRRQLRGTSYRDTVSFQCERGYKLQGSQSRTCGSSGLWSSSQPSCVGEGKERERVYMYIHMYTVCMCIIVCIQYCVYTVCTVRTVCTECSVCIVCTVFTLYSVLSNILHVWCVLHVHMYIMCVLQTTWMYFSLQLLTVVVPPAYQTGMLISPQQPSTPGRGTGVTQGTSSRDHRPGPVRTTSSGVGKLLSVLVSPVC